MELTLRNSNLEAIEIVDTLTSLIWVDRYDENGDFELFVPITEKNLLIFQEDYYLSLDDSEHLMIIESVEINSDIEDGDRLSIKGRSLESILDRRIVWEQTILSGNLQSEVQRVLNENVISPSVPARAIARLHFQTSVDAAITSLSVEGQYTGEYIYDVISSICKASNIGFKITFDQATGFFNFQLYSGKDRSYDQSINAYVVFSPNFENMIESNYFASRANLKTVALVAGEGEGSDRLNTTCVIPAGSGTDLSRRELYVDARDLSKTTESGTLPDVDYLYQLSQRGFEKLANHVEINHFEGEVDTKTLFVYGVDFFMGDIVQISNSYGQGGRSRITEFLFSQNESGINTYPTFKSLS